MNVVPGCRGLELFLYKKDGESRIHMQPITASGPSMSNAYETYFQKFIVTNELREGVFIPSAWGLHLFLGLSSLWKTNWYQEGLLLGASLAEGPQNNIMSIISKSISGIIGLLPNVIFIWGWHSTNSSAKTKLEALVQQREHMMKESTRTHDEVFKTCSARL